jgi:hypothetical protein
MLLQKLKVEKLKIQRCSGLAAAISIRKLRKLILSNEANECVDVKDRDENESNQRKQL